MTQSVSYIILARDKFTDVAKKVARVTRSMNDRMKKFGATAKRIGRSMSSLGKRMAIGVSLPLLALGGFMIKAASDAEETESKFGVVFSKMQKKAQGMADTLNKAYGLSATKAQQLLSDTGDLLSGFGFTQKKALELSNQIVKLSVDVASFKNVTGGADRVTQIMTKALLGERESLKMLGISFNEMEIKRKIQLLLSKGMRFQTMAQAKAMASLQLIMEKSKNSLGDFAKTKKFFANQVRIATGNIQDLAVALGKILIPMATQALIRINKIIKSLTEWVKLNPRMAKILLTIAAIAAAIAPILIAIGGVVYLIGLITPAMFVVAAVVAAFLLFLARQLLVLKLQGKEMANNWKIWFKAIGSFVDDVKSKVDALMESMEKGARIIKAIGNLAFKQMFGFGLSEENSNVSGSNKNINQTTTQSNFNGVLDIQVKDKQEVLGPISFTKSGDLDVGLSKVGI